ncbi:MAG: hypothetical protein KME54_29480 [Tolypothrix brevis GSE-NOS-MK-07-07A]|jgi:hypothetical protein|nr:hypothetical protein [Tolypothrix brevis GSE-NOS-MK-07-07A]
MTRLTCPNCKSPHLEYTRLLDLLQCLSCSVVIWDEGILNEYKNQLPSNGIKNLKLDG